ncbi:unnamed protein product [Meloidogyne enterolobii]|uniref:Uncharacterized protein n=1 Tax=Meloidogyne enterolobii TaxID=390850 RepID=A0ACB1AF43_MELEN
MNKLDVFNKLDLMRYVLWLCELQQTKKLIFLRFVFKNIFN